MTIPTKSGRRTTTLPVTTLEEVPVLDARERDQLLDDLKKSEADISADKGTDYEPGRFRNRLLRIYRGRTR